ncbi:MAG: efflux RND transporter permease subunit [Gemmatimonadetes bacterium]|nr:efflux RND transporter permease subunit [Gemmatimonadota bacterium]MYB99261.1 efflux RND transporter permease subunit [Gemmatimonadota bacterium]MYH52633.1 efflux RND transporter permease subunit [Gemmatimonadota bacterium]MYK67635.1 efflux RND transporter permease subunit [Gemmatimonadota bacterium]
MTGRGHGSPEGRDPRSFKEFALTSLAVENRTSVVVLFAFITIAGLVFYRAIPKESFPETEIPSIAVNTVYPGVSPTDIETLVTRKIEEELNTISGLKELTSTSVEGYSSIIAEFETSTNMDEALRKVRAKLVVARREIPSDAEDPAMFEFSMSDAPVMQVNIAGGYGLVRLKELGEDLQERIEAIPAVLRVDLRGGLEREVKVEVNLSKLQYYNVSFDDVLSAIRQENVNIPGGSIDVNGVNYLVRVDGEFDDPSVVGDLVITTVGGRPIYVRDVAEVDFGFSERTSFARLDEEPVVTLDVVKRSGENIIATAAAVRTEIDAMRPLFPPSTVISITSDMSADIGDMVSSLQNNIISGLILIVGVLLFVLGLRTSIFVAISIPTSMFLSFIVLWALGVSMNMVVLFSLILALGMLVDNAIVIVENIYRFMEEGWDRRTAAKKATGEVAVPVIAATATTLAAFTPLLFWPGMAGQFMQYLPLTLIVTLSSSLFVALVIVPTLCSLFLDPESSRPRRLSRRARVLLICLAGLALLPVGIANPLTPLLFVVTAAALWLLHAKVLDRIGKAFMARGFPRLVGWYERRLRWALEHRALVLTGSVLALVGTVMIYGRFAAPVEYFPEDIPPATVYVAVEAPVGTAAEVTDGYARRLKAELAGIAGLEDAETVVTTVGSGGGGGGFMDGGGPSGPEAGRITVSMVDYQDRRFDVFGTLADMQEQVGRDLAGAEIQVDKVTEGPPSGPPVNIEISGEDPVLLEELANRAVDLIEGAPVYSRLVGLESDMDDARPELRVEVDREKASLYGLSTNDVGFVVRGAINGLEAAKYRTGNDEYDIVVRLREEDRRELTDLNELTAFADGVQIPLLSVADWTVSEGYSSIRRKDMDRVATVSAEVAAGYNSNAVRGEVEALLAEFAAGLPPGYALAFTGEQEDQQEAQEFLMTAFMMALMLIALILVTQFNSVVKPLIILSSVIMSTIGVLIGLLVFQMPFVIIMTGVGVISLAGIVVNNAIVLIDYIDVLRKRDGLNRREAVVQGGKTRLRPVLLTALTTALGLVPLAVGLNFDFFGLFASLSPELFWGGEQAAWWGPMAVAVIVGIIFATFLTLILVPVLYSVVSDLARFFRRSEPEEGAGVTAADGDSAMLVPPLVPDPEREGKVAAIAGS